MYNSAKNWADDEIAKVWIQGKIISGYDPAKYRQDVAGAWIQRDKYGDTSHELGFGWEIDHQKPISEGGTDNPVNLQPLQWSNNRSKGDDYPQWTSVVSSNDTQNARKTQNWTINQ